MDEQPDATPDTETRVPWINRGTPLSAESEQALGGFFSHLDLSEEEVTFMRESGLI